LEVRDGGVRRYEERQLSLDLGQEVDPYVFQIDEGGEHGEVFTRRWVVELILDLLGFTVDRDLGGLVAVEPSCGSGAFLGPMTERLIESCRLHDRPLSDIRTALSAFDRPPLPATVRNCTVTRGILNSDTLKMQGKCHCVADGILTQVLIASET
jgi:hypothetical protein